MKNKADYIATWSVGKAAKAEALLAGVNVVTSEC